MKARIVIYTDMDLHIHSPAAPNYDNMSHEIEAETEEELRHKLVFFLAQLEIRLPYEKEYTPFRVGKRDDTFKQFLYEAMHQIASGGSINFSCGGNQTLTIYHYEN